MLEAQGNKMLILLWQDGDKVCRLSTLALESDRLGSDLGSAPYLPSWVGYLSSLNGEVMITFPSQVVRIK